MAHCYNCLSKFGLFDTKWLTAKFGVPPKVQRICNDCRKCVICGAFIVPEDLVVELAFNGLIPAVIFFCPHHRENGFKLSSIKLEDWPSDFSKLTKSYLEPSRERMSSIMRQHPNPRVSQRLALMDGFLQALTASIGGNHSSL